MFGTSYHAQDQATWEYEQFSKAQVDKVWETIHTTKNFWSTLAPIEPSVLLDDVEDLHTPIFITSRVPVAGILSVEQQTQGWLNMIKFVTWPTVLVVPHWSQKRALIEALRLDAYIDDKPDTVRHLLDAGLNCYIYDQPYNRHVEAPRVKSIVDYINDVEEKLGEL